MPQKHFCKNLDIVAEDIGKRFGRNWIFRHLDFEIKGGTKTAITGSNGSGKSTLIQIISGFLTPTKGKIRLSDDASFDDLHLSFVAPYTDIIEEFSLAEFLKFHAQFRKPLLTPQAMAERASLPLDRPIEEFSTGMKQRTKLIASLFFENDLLFMDEPTSNLDQQGFDWWKYEVSQMQKTVILASNQKNEIELCESSINL